MNRYPWWVLAGVPILSVVSLLAASKCDISGDGLVNLTDIQSIVDEVLGTTFPTHDVNGDGVVNIVDMQAVINSAGKFGCSADPVPTLAFDTIPGQFLGIAPFPMAAKGAAAVAFGSLTNAICRNTSNIVTLVHSGTCSIAATEAGATGAVIRSFAVTLTKQASSFTSPAGSPFAVGTNPNSLATGDFNGDGVPDLAIANTVGNSVTILLGNGSGGFDASSSSPIAIAGGPVSVAVGDFNADGNQDLAVANLNGNTVAVLLGNGSGGFAPAPGNPPATGSNPDFVAVGDFNGDGVQDLAISNLNSNSVTVLLGDGTGAFTAATWSPLATGTNPQAVVVADFNDDGVLDLATPNYAGNLTVLLGRASGGFTPAANSPLAVGGAPSALAVGDFNGDGIPDFAVGTYDTGEVAILLGDGTGGFTAAGGSPYPAGAGRGTIAVADFNGDGIQDLAIATGTGNNVTVLLGNGSGGFVALGGGPFNAGSEPVQIAIGDFNRDGIEDLAVVNLLSSNVTVLLGKAPGAGGLPASRLLQR